MSEWLVEMSARLLTTREAAEYLRIRPETLLAWDRSGKLRGFRISTNALRWNPDEIAAFLRGTREEGPSAAEEVAPVPFQSPDPRRILTTAPVPVTEEVPDAR